VEKQVQEILTDKSLLDLLSIVDRSQEFAKVLIIDRKCTIDPYQEGLVFRRAWGCSSGRLAIYRDMRVCEMLGHWCSGGQQWHTHTSSCIFSPVALQRVQRPHKYIYYCTCVKCRWQAVQHDVTTSSHKGWSVDEEAVIKQSTPVVFLAQLGLKAGLTAQRLVA
jgi:hypothetical protein